MKYLSKKLSVNGLLLFVIFLAVILIFALKPFCSDPGFSVGLITDCQFSRAEDSGLRKYSLSENKLRNCIAHFNTMDLAFVVHLGDFIDKNFSNFDIVQPIFQQLTMPGFHVLGNHDFAVEDNEKEFVQKKLEMPGRYYDFSLNGWRFVILDGNDISFYAYPANTENYREADDYYQRKRIKSPKWNGAIGAKQISWLHTVLEEARQENVILFCHFPVYPEDIHNLWNAREIVEMIEKYPNVRAYISGHNHAGSYQVKKNIHYLTLKGMVETEQTSYAVMTLTEKKIVVTGYGREENKTLLFR